MKATRSRRKVPLAESIARLADRDEDISKFFTNKGRMMQPIQRVNVDFAAPMLNELDTAADELNVSRQAVIKTLIRQALDQRYLARNARRHTRRADARLPEVAARRTCAGWGHRRSRRPEVLRRWPHARKSVGGPPERDGSGRAPVGRVGS